MIDGHREQVVGEAREPTFKEFMIATTRPLRKAAATDGIPTGVKAVVALPYHVGVVSRDGVGMEGRYNAGWQQK